MKVTADGEGRLWLIVGTDSGFEGLSALYYARIACTLTPAEARDSEASLLGFDLSPPGAGTTQPHRVSAERVDPNRMKRLLTCILGVAVTVAAVGLFLLLNPATGARMFFGVDSSPVGITLKGSYRVPPADEKTVAIVAAATHLLGSLNDDQRQAATYAFTDNAQRSNWSNFPESMVPRGGLQLGALSDSQRANLEKLLAELLSEEGVRNIVHQLAAEEMLVPGDRLGLMKYGSEFYCFAFLGAPSTTEPWMFQFGGHHLAINATVFGPTSPSRRCSPAASHST